MTPTARADRARASTTRAPWPGSTWAKASPTSPAGPPTGPSPTKAATTQTTTARSRSRSQRPTPTARSTATRAPTTATPTGPSGSCAGVNDEGPLAGLDLGQSFTNVPGGTANWSFTDQSGNYTDDDGSVEIEITKATLSIDADDKSKTYLAPDPPFTYTLSGFVNGEDEQSAGVTGEASCTREPGESVAGSPYEITCAPGTLDADNYGFETGEAGELTITAAEALVRYIGETIFVSSGSSSTTAKVTLTASLQAVSEQSALGTGTVNFIDANTGKVLAANVPVQPVAGQPNVGTANTNITLSTGQFGAESYLIRVVATGNYTNDDQDDADKTATVVAMKPTTTNSTIGGGTIDPLVPRGIYAGDLDEDATFSIGMQYTSKGTNLKGKITLYVPQADGSIIVVKSNSISSMKVTGTTTKTSTVYTKASISRLDGGVVTAIAGSATLRVDVLEPSTGPANSEVGFTVLSSSSKLFYSNRWVLENNTWKTKTQTLEAGAVDIN